MASHHHHHHCHQPPPPIPTAISTSTTCYCTIANAPPPPSIDPYLFQSLISLLQSSSQNPNPNNPPYHCDPHPNRHTPHQIPNKDPIFNAHKHPYNSQAVLASLVNRIDTLESSFRRRESLTYGSSTVREAAARVIQLRFRAYLVSRSRSLRHLKDLAFIKTRFNALKSSLADQSRLDLVVVSRRTVELLYKVDSIQDRDPMIVNGKKSLTRDLVGFLDYIDAIAVKRHGVVTRAVKKVSVVQTRSDREQPRGLRYDLRGVGRDRRVVIETLRGQYEDVEGEDEDMEVVRNTEEEEIPYISPRVMNKKSAEIGKGSLDQQRAHVGGKKNVSFADDGINRNVISIHERNSKPTTGSSSTGDVKEVLESLRKRVEEMEAGLANGALGDEEEESESGDSAQTSDGEHRGTSSAVATDHKTIHQHPKDDDDAFIFPAPEHLKMDSKTELSNKNLKIKS